MALLNSTVRYSNQLSYAPKGGLWFAHWRTDVTCLEISMAEPAWQEAPCRFSASFRRFRPSRLQPPQID
jgi:hypothetical protein